MSSSIYLTWLVALGCGLAFSAACVQQASETTESHPREVPSGLFVQPGEGETPRVPFARDDKYGFLDDRGRVVLQPQYDWADEFSDGFALCRVEGQGTVIDESGAVVGTVPADAETYLRASPNRVWFRVDKKWGLCDLEGTVLVDPTYDDVSTFSDSLARVNLGATRAYPGFMEGGKTGYIDNDGNVVIDVEFTGVARGFRGNYAVVGDRLIDRQGNVLFTRSGLGSWFSDGLIPVGHSETTEYVDASGQSVFSIVGYGREFSEGLAHVRRDGKSGYIDSEGRVVIEHRFHDAEPFRNGLAAVAVADEQWGYIDRTGNLVTPTHFNEVRPAYENFLIVHVGGERVLPLDASPWWEGGRWLLTDRAGRALAALREDRPPDR